MGASNSRIEDDKALLLCRERRRFVRQALDGRCALAASHVSYIQSLRNTGTALRKFVEPEVPSESSLYTSTSATPDPLSLTDKSTSQVSNSSPSLLQHVERRDGTDSFSPVPSPTYSGRFHANHMKAGRSTSTTVEEKLPIPVTATLQSSTTPVRSGSLSDDNPMVETPPAHGTLHWDYFDLFHPIDNQFPFQDDKLSHGLDDADEIRRLKEELGVPELEEEEEEEKASTDGRDDYSDSDDDFDDPSNEPLVRIFRNRNEVLDQHSVNESPMIPSVESIVSETERQNGEKNMLSNGMHKADGTPEMTTSKTIPVNGKEKDLGPENRFPSKDFFLCIKEIEDLFLKASESGREVPRMLEANKVHFRPLFSEGKARGSKASNFFSAFLSCCTEEAHLPQEPAPDEIKYLTWHRSISSRSSSSRNPLGATSRNDIEDLSSSLFSSMYMNSGSHASTLDRLYAWERKLYDEVKASGIIRREYDMKCRLLRHQDSRGESHYKIDKTRAAVKDLHSRIRVAIHRIDSISKRIEELRDKELQPQLEELIGGLTRMWAMMLDCHKQQYIISIACNNGSTRVSIRSETYRQVTILQFELNSLCSSFTKWMAAHKSYLQAINGWLLKCVFPLRYKPSRRKTIQFSPRRDIAPPIFVACKDWLKLLDELPTKDVADAIKDLVNVTTHFLPRQEKAHGSSSFPFSLSRKAGQRDGAGEDVRMNDAPVDWNLNYDSLQSCLGVFLDRLKTFGESSVVKYEALQKSISDARFAYENVGSRT